MSVATRVAGLAVLRLNFESLTGLAVRFLSWPLGLFGRFHGCLAEHFFCWPFFENSFIL